MGAVVENHGDTPAVSDLLNKAECFLVEARGSIILPLNAGEIPGTPWRTPAWRTRMSFSDWASTPTFRPLSTMRRPKQRQ